MQRIESLTRTRTRVLREKLGHEIDSKNAASSRPDRQVVLSQSEQRDDGHRTRSRVKGKEYDGPLAQVGETMRSKAVCCEVAELEPRWVTRTSWAQQLKLSSFSCSGGPRRMINGSEMDLPCS